MSTVNDKGLQTNKWSLSTGYLLLFT